MRIINDRMKKSDSRANFREIRDTSRVIISPTVDQSNYVRKQRDFACKEKRTTQVFRIA